jgi:hypothetical protein
MVAILAAIFNMFAKTHKQFRNTPMLQLHWYLGFFRGMWFQNGGNFGSHF